MQSVRIRFAVAAVAIAGAAAAANAAVIPVFDSPELHVVSTGRLDSLQGHNGSGSSLSPAVATTNAIYSDISTPAGAYKLGGATTANLNTYAIADDLTTTITAPTAINQMSFTLYNGNTGTTNRSVSPHIRLFDDDGVGGNPGTLLASYDFNPVTLGSGGFYTVLSFNPSAISTVTLPTGTIWALEYLSSVSTGASAAQLNGFGMILENPVDVGSSTFNEFDTTAPATAASNFTANNPVGAIYSGGYGGGTIPADFGFEIVAPEPTSLAALAGAGIMAIRRRRA